MAGAYLCWELDLSRRLGTLGVHTILPKFGNVHVNSANEVGALSVGVGLGLCVGVL